MRGKGERKRKKAEMKEWLEGRGWRRKLKKEKKKKKGEGERKRRKWSQNKHQRPVKAMSSSLVCLLLFLFSLLVFLHHFFFWFFFSCLPQNVIQATFSWQVKSCLTLAFLFYHQHPLPLRLQSSSYFFFLSSSVLLFPSTTHFPCKQCGKRKRKKKKQRTFRYLIIHSFPASFFQGFIPWHSSSFSSSFYLSSSSFLSVSRRSSLPLPHSSSELQLKSRNHGDHDSSSSLESILSHWFHQRGDLIISSSKEGKKEFDE